MLVGREGLSATAESLYGARVAFVQTDSLSGYIAPAQWFKQQGVRLSELGEVVFAGNHSAALGLLDSGRVDVAATFDSVFSDYQSRNPASALVVLARFEDLPNAMLVARPSMTEDEAALLFRALRDVWIEPDLSATREALSRGAAMDGIVPASVDALHGVGRWLE